MKARTTLTAALVAVATGSAALAMAAPAGAAAPKQTLKVTATPHSKLVNGSSVTFTATGFSASDNGSKTVVAAECSAAVAKSGSNKDCDTNLADLAPVTVANKTGTGTITVHTGSKYSDSNGGRCNAANACFIVVENLANTKEVGGAPISFKSPLAATKTKVTSKKTVAKGKKLAFTVKTTPKGTASFSGKVTLTANGKKLKSVKETKSGKVTFKHAFKKKGKYTIKATYGGNTVYKGSHGTKKITVKK